MNDPNHQPEENTMTALANIIDEGVTLYIPIILWDDGTYTVQEMTGPGYTSDELVDAINTGNVEDIAAIMCIWGNGAGTDFTEIIRGEAFNAIDWYGEAEDIDRNTSAFVKAHKDYPAALAEHVKGVEEQRRHEESERRGY